MACVHYRTNVVRKRRRNLKLINETFVEKIPLETALSGSNLFSYPVFNSSNIVRSNWTLLSYMRPFCTAGTRRTFLVFIVLVFSWFWCKELFVPGCFDDRSVKEAPDPQRHAPLEVWIGWLAHPVFACAVGGSHAFAIAVVKSAEPPRHAGGGSSICKLFVHRFLRNEEVDQPITFHEEQHYCSTFKGAKRLLQMGRNENRVSRQSEDHAYDKILQEFVFGEGTVSNIWSQPGDITMMKSVMQQTA